MYSIANRLVKMVLHSCLGSLTAPTKQKTTATKAIALLVLVGEQCRPELAQLG
jgi:hypothetical protein